MRFKNTILMLITVTNCIYIQCSLALEKPWIIKKDANNDGVFTISDVNLWLKWLFFLPGNLIIYYIIKFLPSIAHFFELSQNDFNGILSAILSIVIWILIFTVMALFK